MKLKFFSNKNVKDKSRIKGRNKGEDLITPVNSNNNTSSSTLRSQNHISYISASDQQNSDSSHDERNENSFEQSQNNLNSQGKNKLDSPLNCVQKNLKKEKDKKKDKNKAKPGNVSNANSTQQPLLDNSSDDLQNPTKLDNSNSTSNGVNYTDIENTTQRADELLASIDAIVDNDGQGQGPSQMQHQQSNNISNHHLQEHNLGQNQLTAQQMFQQDQQNILAQQQELEQQQMQQQQMQQNQQQQELDPYLYAHQQTPITLPQIVNHLDAIHFPPQQLIHLGEIKTTWTGLNNEVSEFTSKFNPTLEQIIEQHETLISKTSEMLNRMPATTVSTAATEGSNDGGSSGTPAGPVVRSARFRGGGGSQNSASSNRSNPANRRLAAEWETFAKKVLSEFTDVRTAFQYYLNTQHFLTQELSELDDTIDETDTVQLKLLQFKSDYQKLARDYRTLQFKLQHSKSQLIINATYDRCPDASVLLQQEMKNIENTNLLLEKRNSELIEELTNLKMTVKAQEQQIKETKSEENKEKEEADTNEPDKITKMEIQLLRESISAISKENDKLQMLYQKSLRNLHLQGNNNNELTSNNNSQDAVELAAGESNNHANSSKDESNRNNANTSEVQSYLEDEIAILQEGMREAEGENDTLKSENKNMQHQLVDANSRINSLQNQVNELKARLQQSANTNSNSTIEKNHNDDSTASSITETPTAASAALNGLETNSKTSLKPSIPPKPERSLELEAKLKKLKAQNDRYKKDRKRANQLATTMPEISMVEELENLKKASNLPASLISMIEEKYETLKEQNAVLTNELKKGGKYTSSKSSKEDGVNSPQVNGGLKSSSGSNGIDVTSSTPITIRNAEGVQSTEGMGIKDRIKQLKSNSRSAMTNEEDHGSVRRIFLVMVRDTLIRDKLILLDQTKRTLFPFYAAALHPETKTLKSTNQTITTLSSKSRKFNLFADYKL